MSNHDFWEHKWSNNQTSWDIGVPSPAICDFIDQYEDKNAAVLIPGCGNAYEATYLIEQGFTNITLLDIAETAIDKLKERFKNIAAIKILCGDFFEHQNKYDLIVEQTFFCAIEPNLRDAYVKQSASLLNKNGLLTGLLFNRVFDTQGPPFGGTKEEYSTLFELLFDIELMENTTFSILPRKDSELFILLKKK